MVAPMKAVFDTCILIDFLRGIKEAQQELNRYENRIISVITYIETMVGASTSEEIAATKSFLKHFELAGLTNSIAEKSIQLRQRHILKIPDAIIYATAKEQGCLIVTRNTKDFSTDWPDVRIPYHIKPPFN